MTITTTKLTRAAGLAAVAGGLLFIAVQIKHPLLDATFTTTTEYAVRETMKIFMAVLSLIGITGIYLRQVRQIGVLGLIGYLAVRRRLPRHPEHPGRRCVRPPVPCGQPARLRQRRPRRGHQRHPVGDVGALPDPHQDRRFTYIAGGIVFGIALFRAEILARWAAALLAVGAVATVATFQLPSSTSGCSPSPSASP